MKHIAIFADGTWNSPETERPTNVLMTARAVAPENKAGVNQVAFYDWGVGSDGKRVVGGLTGEGIDKNIMDCYRFLVHNYEPGDKLYFFGFSRGAYTVRSLGGFIRNCGLLKRESAGEIQRAYEFYRKRGKNYHPDSVKGKALRAKYAVADITPIEFIGVWDTVGSLGIPVPFWGTLGAEEFLFHDTQPSRIVKHARHALSIDEDREDFAETSWDHKPGLDVKQVWFAGVHSDIGGGYPEAGLCACAADWMMKEAEKFEFKFSDYLSKLIKPNPHDKIHKARTGMFHLRPENVRTIQGPLHSSVKQRWDADTQGYRKKSKAMRKLLQSVGNDWSKIEVVD